MQARFLHFADCHLGYRQYNNNERYNDFARAFLAVIQTAIDERVDFVLLAGDLFQKRAIDALTLNQAMRGLEKLQAAGIPCIAVEGNHEHSYYQDHIGWLEFLALRDLLILLDAEFKDGKPDIKPYERRKGSYIDMAPGLRIHGLRYNGAGAPRAIEAYANALAELPRDGIEYTIFVTHAGMEGVLPEEVGGLTYHHLAHLRPHVDYLALGHIHKPYEADGWVYNPGSIETCSSLEASWPERGYYLVHVDTGRAQERGGKHVAALRTNLRRPFHRMTIKTDLHATPDDLCHHCQEVFTRRARDVGARRGGDSRPVVELHLTGVLAFDHHALEVDRIQQMINEAFDPLHVLIKNATRAVGYEVEVEEGASRADLERGVLTSLFAQDGRFAEHSEQWTQTALSLKRMALEGASPSAIVDELDHRVRQIEALPAASSLA
jgi:DNA repair exonuclease SbcCD nuclease subunit